MQVIVGEAKAFHRAGDEILDQDVALGGDVLERLLAVGMGEVEGDALLATIDADKVVAFTLDERAGATGQIAALRVVPLL